MTVKSESDQYRFGTSDGDPVEAQGRASTLSTGLVFSLVLISPLGAPLMAVVILSTCDVGFFGGTTRCFLPDSILTYYFLSIAAPLVLGPWAVLWFTLCLSALAISGCKFVNAIREALAQEG